MVDRYGPRRALPPMAAAFAVILIAIAVIPARDDVAGVGEGAGEPVQFGHHEGVAGPAGGQRCA